MTGEATADRRRPCLSVVVVVGERRDRAELLLQSLAGQRLGEALEVLVIDLAPELALAGTDAKGVRVVPMPVETLFGEARARGVEEARAPVVAFLEEHVRVRPGWARAILHVHEKGFAGVGALVHVANPGVGRSDIASLITYGYWYPPRGAGATEMIPGHNSSYDVEVLRSLGDDLPRLLDCDVVLQSRLRREGYLFGVAPAAHVEHLSETCTRSLARGLRLWYRIYAPMRAREERWPLTRRLCYAFAFPAMPFYFAVRFDRYLREERPQSLPLFRRNLPFVLAVFTAAGAGMAMGILFGAGGAPRAFTRYELTEDRPWTGAVERVPAKVLAA